MVQLLIQVTFRLYVPSKMQLFFQQSSMTRYLFFLSFSFGEGCQSQRLKRAGPYKYTCMCVASECSIAASAHLPVLSKQQTRLDFCSQQLLKKNKINNNNPKFLFHFFNFSTGRPICVRRQHSIPWQMIPIVNSLVHLWH